MPAGLPVIAVVSRIALTAALVVGASMATERAGPLLGALIITLPIGAGPSYFFLALDHPPHFIAASALGSLAVNAANGVFGLVYVAFAQRRGLVFSLASALAVWIAVAIALRAIEWTLPRALVLNAATYAACLPLAARFRHTAMPIYRRRWYDAPLRAVLVCAIVTAVLTLSTRVGPTATGILATAPIVMTSMALILQPRVGGAVAAAVIANGLTGLVGFGASLVVLHLAALRLGNAAALTLGAPHQHGMEFVPVGAVAAADGRAAVFAPATLSPSCDRVVRAIGRLLAAAARTRNRGGHAFDETDDRQPQACVLDGGEGPGKPERARVGQETEVGRRPRVGGAVDALEQRRHRNLQACGDPQEPAAADPARPRLVFLHLLEREAEPLGELQLRQAFGQAPDAHIASDCDVDGAGGPCRHSVPQCKTRLRTYNAS